MFQIRPATVDDAGALVELSSQLGYPSSREQLQHRLTKILADPTHAVFITEDIRARKANSALAGWVHVYIERTLENDPTVEIGGLIVEETQRGFGVGRLLIERAQCWAQNTGCSTMTVRSNVLRTGAHAFYQRLGYLLVKTQKVFRRSMEPT